MATVRTRIHGIYSALKRRVGAKHWQSGKRKGQLRQVGEELPFSEAELFRWYDAQTLTRCPFCLQPIDALSASIDHMTPLSRGGSLGLDNLECICELCNRIKGGLTRSEFAELSEWMMRIEPLAHADLVRRLRAAPMWRHR